MGFLTTFTNVEFLTTFTNVGFLTTFTNVGFLTRFTNVGFITRLFKDIDLGFYCFCVFTFSHKSRCQSLY